MLRLVSDRIHLITDPHELRGTLYIELMPGAYEGKCWCDGSVFLSEEAFRAVECAFRRHVPEYDYYSFMELPRLQGVQLVAELTSLARALRGDALVAPLPPGAADDLERIRQDTDVEPGVVAELATRLATWLESEFRRHEVVSVLGL